MSKILALSLSIMVLFAVVVAQQDSGVTLPANFTPSVETGEHTYAQQCASCHGADGSGGSAAQPDFTQRDWKQSLAPSHVVAVSLGQASDHPAAVSALEDAWHATAYVWTLSMTATDFETGLSEANRAADLMKKGGLGFLITKGHEIQELRSQDWVLFHTPAEVIAVIQDLAADEYNTLDTEHQDALVDYVFASYFQVPSGW